MIVHIQDAKSPKQAWDALVKMYVKQLLSLYLRFYKVTMLESTNATDEGRMRMYV
jgi:hypothetical protein